MTPKHIAIDLRDHVDFDVVRDIIEFQIKKDIPIFTLNLVRAGAKREDDSVIGLDKILDELILLGHIYDHKIKISILGKWYDLPGKVVEKIKKLIDVTREYDQYFLNLCVNYSGHEEIVDAAKLIGRKIALGKLSVEEIDAEEFKDNLYSSYFLPPDILICDGNYIGDFLLWDCVNSFIYLNRKEFSISVVRKAIRDRNN